ncbi:Hypothetical Protein SLY_0937 [Strawberry lethal yellows phytoplasma (CPA) str. NZSb11]|uniref:Uncharacterized protein n=1 Tax=Strawberry lethal yellows phytoplasma (CPA) str. NZSb11 TaxID=980422 RepID=R4RY59_PHYAS|nr:Hypothetical Protein SLY_0937 [Strawberry lethal yellows phytoplasma (CPA) str. NZSb11]
MIKKIIRRMNNMSDGMSEAFNGTYFQDRSKSKLKKQNKYKNTKYKKITKKAGK